MRKEIDPELYNYNKFPVPLSFCSQRNFNSFLVKSDASHQIYDRIKCYSK